MADRCRPRRAPGREAQRLAGEAAENDQPGMAARPPWRIPQPQWKFDRAQRRRHDPQRPAPRPGQSLPQPPALELRERRRSTALQDQRAVAFRRMGGQRPRHQHGSRQIVGRQQPGQRFSRLTADPQCPQRQPRRLEPLGTVTPQPGLGGGGSQSPRQSRRRRRRGHLRPRPPRVFAISHWPRPAAAPVRPATRRTRGSGRDSVAASGAHRDRSRRHRRCAP